jgi:hypothetical protein
MAQFELVMFATNFDVGRIDDARAGSPRDYSLSLFFADLEIVIKKSSRIRWHALPAFAYIPDGEIWELDFLASPVFHTRPVRSPLFQRSLTATDWPSESQYAADQENEGRSIFRVPEVFGVFWNIGSDSSTTTQGNLSSRKIAFCGANGPGSSSDAIVTSIASESLLSSKNKCVPQHAANERIRFACAILRGSPRVTTKSSRGTDPQVTYGAPALRRQSMQWQSTKANGRLFNT